VHGHACDAEGAGRAADRDDAAPAQRATRKERRRRGQRRREQLLGDVAPQARKVGA
jgi:hypothetical protein